MCGIFGIYPARISELETISIVKNIKTILQNRGPDDHDYWKGRHHEPLLIHTRLALLDESENGKQPMKSRNGNMLIVFNGEIYNHKELRAAFKSEKKDFIFKGFSDTEILLEYLENYNYKKTLNKLKGMYAFATWNRSEEKLTLVRDRFGEKPLYWLKEIDGNGNERIIFSSDLLAIKKASRQNFEISKKGLDEYLRNGFIYSENTIYNNINRLEPGSIVEFELDKKENNLIKINKSKIKYWTIERYNSNIRIQTEQEYLDRLEDLLTKVIKETSHADSDVGMMLSGGIDSSLIASIYSKISTKKIKTFTAIFEDKEQGIIEDEYFSKKVANHLESEHNEIRVSGSSAIEMIDKITQINCEPFADMSQIPVLAVSKKIKNNNLKAVLSGDGADELFGGYEKYQALLILKSLSNFKNERIIKLVSNIAKITYSIRYQNQDYKRVKLNRIINAFKSKKGIFRAVNEIYPELSVSNTNKIFNNKEYLSLDLKEYMKDDISRFLHGCVLTKMDRTTMAASVESRAPFLDERIARFAWELPESLLLRKNGLKLSGKFILRKLLSKYLNKEIVNAPKRGFIVPMGNWLRGPLKEMGHANIKELLNRNIFEDKNKEIEYIWNNHINGDYDFSKRLWNLISLNLWLSKHN